MTTRQQAEVVSKQVKIITVSIFLLIISSPRSKVKVASTSSLLSISTVLTSVSSASCKMVDLFDRFESEDVSRSHGGGVGRGSAQSSRGGQQDRGAPVNPFDDIDRGTLVTVGQLVCP